MDIEQLREDPVTAARALVGAEVHANEVRLRIVEVEAYGGPEGGPWPDSAAHSYRGPTARNAVMFGPAGHLYVYLSYGMHLCMNVVCGPDGEAAAVLLRAAEVLDGHDVVRTRRGGRSSTAKVASGPGNLGQALGITLEDNGTNLFDDAAAIRLRQGGDRFNPEVISSGPRVGVSTAADRPWRLWTPSSTSVSAYRRSPRAAPPARARG